MNRRALAALAVLLMVCCIPAVSADSEDKDWVLIDMGDGVTYWSEAGSGTDAIALAEQAASSFGLTVVKDGNKITSIGGMAEHSVKDRLCSWHLFTWSGTEWVVATGTSYSGGSIAWGFYPDGIAPVETPEYRTAWIQFRGDSAASGVSDSYGTEKAVTPVEWYKTYRTGYVDSSIIVAGDKLYHTTYGETSAEGTRSHACLYCLNRFTSETIWKFDLTTGGGTYPDTKDFGYNITSPVIVDDMIAINSATSHDSGGKTVMGFYLLDRMTGELIDHEEILHSPPLDEFGTIVWDGRTFVNGGSTPSYDSGALYFGTSDGRILAYSASRENGLELLWECVPPSDVDAQGKYIGCRGSIYYYSPTIVDVDGVRTLFIGNYDGYILAVDASTGELLWNKRLIALYDKNKAMKGTPGCVDLITYIGDNRLVAVCKDGSMSPSMGLTVCIDTRTGKGSGDSDYYWIYDGLFQGTVPVDGGFIAYADKANYPSAEGPGVKTITEEGVYRMDVNGEVVWRVDSHYIGSRMTTAAGLVYMSEYSAGMFDDGGHIIAKRISDGSTVWSIKLEPYSSDSYCMAAPTVVDGKIYTANDYGAVYCISEIQGKQWNGGGEIILPNGFWHWSWALLIAVAAIAVIALIKYY